MGLTISDVVVNLSLDSETLYPLIQAKKLTVSVTCGTQHYAIDVEVRMVKPPDGEVTVSYTCPQGYGISYVVGEGHSLELISLLQKQQQHS